MIVRCPSCSLRVDLPSVQAATGAMLVDCPSCGHGWIESNAVPDVLEPLLEPVADAATAPKEPDTVLLLDQARKARIGFETERQARRLRQAAWAGLLALGLSPFAAAACLPEQVVAAIPASIAVYEWMGEDVNIYGLEIRHIDLQHLVVDGQKVIAVKGELANVSSGVRKIPWLRFGLRSKDNAEVYHWTLDTDARPLKPGESTGFVTRLASPPEAARNLEIRFARADEIGSNAAP